MKSTAAILVLAGFNLLEWGCASAPAATPAPAAAAAVPAEFARAPRVPLVVSAETAALVADGDRTEADRAIDDGRHPGELLTFLGLKPGMRAAELLAGTGYTTELMARATAPGGVVYAQNTQWLLEKFAAQPWAECLARPANKGVVRVDRELDDPLPPEARDLDLVIISLTYHDTVWMKADRARMNGAVFAALKPGGAYVVVDHSSIPGHGIDDVMTLHRMDEATVVQEVSAAGFVLSDSAGFLRNPEDDRDWNDSPKVAGARRGTSDRFVLLFRKPSK